MRFPITFALLLIILGVVIAHPNLEAHRNRCCGPWTGGGGGGGGGGWGGGGGGGGGGK
ncbi:putative uncharacterized protein DDB_G0287183 [Ceratitis capitata]|uniref:putative uncharacterized protein DDB_G0287183 n=1 Tax=Ceratitis capitata TaxID=7213 RepID=UPI0006188784|nr:putative uncharacterized protein DDB_G0287183 [Ceratitis capitata]